MQYLKIENPGFTSTECFTMLGVSTSRNCGNSDVIGQFGSGFKHSINLCLRKDVKLHVFSSKLCLEFAGEAFNVNDNINTKSFNRVVCRITGKDEEGKTYNRTEKLGWTLEYGAADWDTIGMALREFIANAYDRTIRLEKQLNCVAIELVNENQVRAKDGFTRIFIEATPEVLQYFNQLKSRFLHTVNLNNKLGILEKAGRSLNDTDRAMVYKKGVYVRQAASYYGNSIFDYNLGDELPLDECRNANDYDIRRYASQRLIMCSNPSYRTKLLRSLGEQQETWEASFPEETMMYKVDEFKDELSSMWKGTFGSLFGKNAVITQGEFTQNDLTTGKGYTPVTIKSKSWFKVLEKLGIPTYTLVLSKDELEGISFHEIPAKIGEEFSKVWSLLSSNGVTGNKDKPSLKVFSKLVDAGKQPPLGYYKEGCVHINKDWNSGKQLFITLLEECVHYITGSTDCSRDFQEYLLNLCYELNK